MRTAADSSSGAWEPIARDGDTVFRPRNDDTVLVMPSMTPLKPGTTMARLGRIVPLG